MDDSLLVRVLNAVADLQEEFESLGGGEVMLVAEVGDFDPAHELHDEEGPARVGGAGVEDLRNVGVVHHGQRLPLRLEPGDHLLGIHAELNDLEGNVTPDVLLLLGHPDHTSAAFADLLQELVSPDARARHFRAGVWGRSLRVYRGGVHEFAARLVGLEQRRQPLAQRGVVATLSFQERGPFLFGQEQRLREELLLVRVR